LYYHVPDPGQNLGAIAEMEIQTDLPSNLDASASQPKKTSAKATSGTGLLAGSISQFVSADDSSAISNDVASKAQENARKLAAHTYVAWMHRHANAVGRVIALCG